MSFSLNQPANRWEDAIPVGNGSLGALVFGHIAEDWIVLNDHRCWLEKPRGELPHLAPQLAEIRRLQAEGRWGLFATAACATGRVAARECAGDHDTVWRHG